MGICQSKTEDPTKPKSGTVSIPSEPIPSGADTSKTKKEMGIDGNIPIPMDVSNKVLKSICKITAKNNSKTIFATGVFMKITEAKKYLITNNHVISQEKINWDIEIEIYNHKTMKLNFNNREVQYFPWVKDITIVEIKNYDSIYNDIEFLDYDLNYKRGYNQYKDTIIIIIQDPLGKKAFSSSERIVKVYDNEFDHNITTHGGSSGCPIKLYTENENSIQVIGIHKEGIPGKGLNTGIFIGEIFKNNGGNNPSNNNYIIAEIYINDENINREIQIINSYENYSRRCNFKIIKEYMNEEEIKKCEIIINDKLIPFTYLYKFTNKGKYIIKYSFYNYLSITNHMLSGCSSITNINLSNFNIQNVTDMSYMFSDCSSLINKNLSNFNTQNITNMNLMF